MVAIAARSAGSMPAAATTIRKLPNRRRIVFSLGVMPAVVHDSAVGRVRHRSVQLAKISSLSENAGNDHLAFGNEGFYGHAPIWELSSQPLHDSAYVPRPIDVPWFAVTKGGECVLDVIVGHELRTDFEIL